MAKPLPLSDLSFIEFGITYMMLVPSRLQFDLLGKKLDVPANKITAATIKAALESTGFHFSDQLLTRFQTYILFLVKDKNRATLTLVRDLLFESGEYSGDPPHPPDGRGQSLASALEGLAGHEPKLHRRKKKPKKKLKQ